MTVKEIIDRIIAVEGGKYTNDPNDSGGPTRWGVTQKAYSDYLGRPASVAEIVNLDRQTAYDVMLKRHYLSPHFDKVHEISAPIAEELTDTGVNCGVETATIMLQRALNAFNLQGKRYQDSKVDGDCGPMTRANLQTFINWRGAEGVAVMLRALNCLQGERYIDLAERRPKDETFVYGWLLNRVKLEAT